MATVSINRILTTQDRIVLDQEYENIMNNLSLGNIKSDSDILELYRKIMDTISHKRLRNKEAELLQSRYDDEMKNNFMDRVSAVAGTFEISSGNLADAGAKLLTGNVVGLIGLIGEVAVGCVSGYFMYQDNTKIREGIDSELWRLKADDINDINEIKKQLFTEINFEA